MKELIKELTSRRLLPAIMVGLLIGVTDLFFHISLATLIFSGDLSAFVPDGIGIILFGAVAMSAAVALLGSLAGAMPVIQDTPAAIMAIAAASIAAQMPQDASPEQVYYTVVAAISLTTIATGILYLIVGKFKLSSIVRFVPYPVVGGFLAGSGWLLVKGSIGVMSDVPMGISTIPTLLQPDILLRWVPGSIFAIALVLAGRRFRHPLLMPAFLLAGVAIFYVILLATGTSIAEATAGGQLLDAFPQKALWSPLKPSALGFVDWPVVFSQSGKLITIVVLSTISLLLNCNGLELAVRKDLEFDREMIAGGVGNVLAGLGGSPVGYQSVSTTTLANRMGGSLRTATLVAGVFLAIALLFGSSVLSYFPKAILGGLLLYLGVSFLLDWVYDAARSLPRIDYALILLILLIVATVGFLPAVGVGTVIAVILFVVTYSRVDFVKDTLSGLTFRSRTERPAEHRRLLDEKGGQIHVLRLQGFLFFGTAQNLLQRIRERMRDRSLPPLRFLLLDFHRVSDMDSSAVMSFTRMYQLAEADRIYLVVTEVTPTVRARLERGGLVEREDGFFRVFPTLDYGMEWCEGRMLAEDQRSMIARAANLNGQLQKVFSDPAHIERFMHYLERLEIEQGLALLNQGDASNAMYFVDSGRVSAQLESEPGKLLRLRSMGGGTVVGEVGMYLKQARNASVFTDVPSVVYRLTETSLAEMELKDPDLAANLHHWMVRMLAQRLTDNNLTLEALLS